MTEPTDSEILDAADDFRSQYMHGGITFDEFDSIGFARAVLAKFGTPPAMAGQLADEQIEDLLECGNPTDEEKRLIRLGWDAARNAQAVQAGAVPLTDAQSHALIKRMANEAEQWAEGLSYEPTQEQLSGWRVA